MRFYKAYGLKIGSELALPELVRLPEVEHTLRPDVTICFGGLDFVPGQVAADLRAIEIRDDGIYLYWVDVGSFLVRNGSEIIVDPAPGATEALLRLFILGTTFAMLLHQRGEMAVLHASAVSISGHAAVFVGTKGAGKSTTAATLSERGHDLIADDIVAVDLQQSPPVTLPGFAHLKLWPDSLAALGQEPEALPKLRPELEKRGFRPAAADGSRGKIPVKQIYLLCVGDELDVSPIPSKQALLALLPHWYGARFEPEVLQSLGAANHFQECAALVQHVPVFRLQRPRSLARLPEVARAVEEHCLLT